MSDDNSEAGVTEFDEEEFLPIMEIAQSFLDKGVSGNPPQFVIITGSVGSGKTTLRRKKYADGYVHFEYGEILGAIRKKFGEDNPRLTDYVTLAGTTILQQSLESKKNIVIETLGENKDVIVAVASGMKKIGYQNSLQFVECDRVEGYNRHLKAVKEDPEYFSAYFTEEATLSFFYKQLGLGQMPMNPDTPDEKE